MPFMHQRDYNRVSQKETVIRLVKNEKMKTDYDGGTLKHIRFNFSR